jgi:hypothetical protein
MEHFKRPEGHEKCHSSTGIHGPMTFGSGELNEYGYWENPCYECARAFEKQFPKYYPCWPHTEEQLKKMYNESLPVNEAE